MAQNKIPINTVDNKMVIYKTTNLVNGKIYIGQDSKNNPNYLGSGDLLKRAILKYGKDNFIKEILCYCNTQKDLDDKEVYYINDFQSFNKGIGYNIAIGGRGGTMTNRKHSEKTKLNMSKSHKGKVFSDKHKNNIGKSKKGKKLTDNHKNKISDANRGRKFGPLTVEHKDKISEAHKGKTISDETRIKMSKSHEGVNNHFYGSKHTISTKNLISKKNSKKVYQYTIEGDLINIWNSLTKCSKGVDISISYISHCIRNNKIIKNYIFSYE